MRIFYISPEDFNVGEYVFAKWDDKPQKVIKKDTNSYMIMRGENNDVPQWLGFEDTMSSLEVVLTRPQYAYLYCRV